MLRCTKPRLNGAHSAIACSVTRAPAHRQVGCESAQLWCCQSGATAVCAIPIHAAQCMLDKPYAPTHPAPSMLGKRRKAHCRLAKLCQDRNTAYQGRYSSLAAGTIIDVIALADGVNRELQTHVCRAFNVDVILVLADDKLHSSLSNLFQVSSLLTWHEQDTCPIRPMPHGLYTHGTAVIAFPAAVRVMFYSARVLLTGLGILIALEVCRKIAKSKSSRCPSPAAL
jgi:hypothetical protein